MIAHMFIDGRCHWCNAKDIERNRNRECQRRTRMEEDMRILSYGY